MSQDIGGDRIHVQGSLSVVRSLMYAMVCIRPYIAHAMGVVSRYMNNAGKENWKAVHWILRYLRGTTSHALCFGVLDTIVIGIC